MEYEPQTLDQQEMEERLELLDNEFFALAKVMNIITTNTDIILYELEQRINSLTSHTDTEVRTG